MVSVAKYPVGLPIQGFGPKTDPAVGGGGRGAGPGASDGVVLEVNSDKQSDAPEFVEARAALQRSAAASRETSVLWAGGATGLNAETT